MAKKQVIHPKEISLTRHLTYAVVAYKYVIHILPRIIRNIGFDEYFDQQPFQPPQG